MSDNNTELTEIISFLTMKRGYCLTLGFENSSEHTIRTEYYHYHELLWELEKNKPLPNFKFNLLKESTVLNSLITNQLDIIKSLSDENDLKYYLLSKYENDPMKKIDLLKKSLICKTGNVLVPEAFMSLIEINFKHFESDQTENNYLKVIKYIPYIYLFLPVNKNNKLITTIIDYLSEDNQYSHYLDNIKIASYFNIIYQLGNLTCYHMIENKEEKAIEVITTHKQNYIYEYLRAELKKHIILSKAFD